MTTSAVGDILLPVTIPSERDLGRTIKVGAYAPYVSGFQVLIGQKDGELDTLAQALGLSLDITEEYTDGYQLYVEMKYPYVYPGFEGMGYGLFTKVDNGSVGYHGFHCGADGVSDQSHSCRSRYFDGEIDDTVEAPDFWAVGEYEYNIDNIFKWQCETVTEEHTELEYITTAKCWLYLPVESFVYPQRTTRFSKWGGSIQQFGYKKGVEKDSLDYHYWYNAGNVTFTGASAIIASATALVAATLAF